jgi:hypothetical protein
LWW